MIAVSIRQWCMEINTNKSSLIPFTALVFAGPNQQLGPVSKGQRHTLHWWVYTDWYPWWPSPDTLVEYCWTSFWQLLSREWHHHQVRRWIFLVCLLSTSNVCQTQQMVYWIGRTYTLIFLLCAVLSEWWLAMSCWSVPSAGSLLLITEFTASVLFVWFNDHCIK